MHILFDNGTPRQLRYQLLGHEVETCRERGWDRLTNGELLDQAEAAGFELLITTDYARIRITTATAKHGGSSPHPPDSVTIERGFVGDQR